MTTDSKAALRAELLAARTRLAPERRAVLSREVAARAVALSSFERARTVALYAPMGAEVDPAEIARRAISLGKRVAFPRLADGARALEFAACAPEELSPGALRTREPPASAAAVALDEIDLVLVPGVGFDPEGRRLGRGRGHYDATLAALPASASRVGLAFELQIVPRLPHEAHDELLDAVVTDSRVLVPPAFAGAARGASR